MKKSSSRHPSVGGRGRGRGSGSGRGRGSGKKLRGGTESFSSSSMNLKVQHDEEISSSDDDDNDDDNDYVNGKGNNKRGRKQGEEDSEDEENIVETAEEKRRRLARGYLQQMEALVKDEEEGEHGEEDEDGEGFDAHLSERLKRDRLEKKGKYYREFSEHFGALNMEDVTQRHLYGHHSTITALALSSDESSVFTGSKDNSILRWDTETGQKQELKRKWSRKEDGEQQCHEGEILTVAVSSDGRYVVGGGKDTSIRVYDKRSKYAEVHIFRQHKEAISTLAFQTGTYALFSGSFDRCVKYWDLNEMGYIETLFGHQDAVHAMDCWHKLRPTTVSNDRSIRTWKVAESSHLVYRGHKAPIDAVQLLTDETFVSGSQDGKICLWKDSKKTPISTIVDSHGQDAGSARWVSSLASIKASDSFASGSNDGFVRLWSTQNDKIAPVAAVPVSGFVNGLALTTRLLVAGCGREHRFGRWWNMKKCKDRLTIMRFPSDLAELVSIDENEDIDTSSDSENSNEGESGSEDSDSSD